MTVQTCSLCKASLVTNAPSFFVTLRAVCAGCDNFHHLTALSHQKAAQAINIQGVHILIDLMGHTRFNRLQILALHPSPIQLHHIGSLQAVGAAYLPLLVSDAVSSPPETAAMYSEKLIYLPQHLHPASHRHVEPPPSSCEWTDTSPVSAVLPAPGKGCVFAVLNDNSKVTPAIASSWLDILEAAPQATLWTSLQGACSSAIATAPASSSLSPASRTDISERVKAHRFADEHDFRRAYRRADIFLDTPNYGACSTALLGLWLGVAMVTAPGETQKQRALASMLVTHGAPHTIARNLEEYRRICVLLALRPAWLRRLRGLLLERNAHSPLFHTSLWVKGLERALSNTWELYALTQPESSAPAMVGGMPSAPGSYPNLVIPRDRVS